MAIYDETGVTGHPDHIQVHRVGLRAAALAGIGQVFQGAMSRSQAQGLVRHALSQGAVSHGADAGGSLDAGAGGSLDIDLADFGTPDELTDKIDVRDYLDQKRRAMAAHASQVSETSMFLTMPPELFESVWGRECVLRRGGHDASIDDLLAASRRRRCLTGSAGFGGLRDRRS